jgi:predicted NAD-dependent protein-ADP-ribosyltransferase YbiA (DUF1768 family)
LSFTWPHDRKYPFLSNLYKDPVTIDGRKHPHLSDPDENPVTIDRRTYICAEAAYQASKTNNPVIKDRFTGVDGLVAYALSRRLGLYHQNLDGDNLDALRAMFEVLIAKFSQLHSASREYLRTTGDAFLLAIDSDYTQSGLTWATRSNGTGLNMIGFMLMYIRELNAMEFEDRYVDFPWYRWFSRHSDDGIYKRDLDPDNLWQQFVISACSAVQDHKNSICAMAGCGRPSNHPHRYCSRTCAYNAVQAHTGICARAGCERSSFPPHRYCCRTCASMVLRPED